MQQCDSNEDYGSDQENSLWTAGLSCIDEVAYYLWVDKLQPDAAEQQYCQQDNLRPLWLEVGDQQAPMSSKLNVHR